MAASRPVVATRVGGIPDAVRDGETGLLVPPADPEALAAALRRLFEDAALRERFGRAGNQAARDGYGMSTVLQQVEQLYTELAGRAT
jgi:glycosyltransferase involved in cell wall biosynthesis